MNTETILDRMELTYVTILDRRDLVGLLRRRRDIPTGERQSFYQADLVLEARDDEGVTRHVAVEASYTADRWDSGRALRNAQFLQRCTGHPRPQSSITINALGHQRYRCQRPRPMRLRCGG